jgi:hypothetical protein
MATLPPDWNEFIGLLNAHRVRYLIVGAHALAANGRPRATQDLDVFIERTPANVARLAAALRSFGFVALAPLRIDIMNHIDGVSFKDAWKGRLKAQFGDHPVAFLGLDQLRANKLASGRAKDRVDVALLDEMDRTAPDRKARGPRSARGTKRVAKRDR